MKKLVSVLTVAALLGSAAAFAEGVKVSGYVRAGYSSTTGDDAEQSTVKWLAGDYFGGKSRTRFNISWDNADNTAGAFLRLQYSGAFENIKFDDGNDNEGLAFVYADAHGKILNNKVVVAAGKIHDVYVLSDGWDGQSVIDGRNGFFAGVTPIDGLVIGGGAVVDYGASANGNADTDKKALVAAAKYTNDNFSVDAGYTGVGAFNANVNITAIKGLVAAFEYEYESDDSIDKAGSVFGYSSENTLVQWFEYTGIDKLTLGFDAYEYINIHSSKIADSSNFTATLNPAASYNITDAIAATLEGTYVLYNYDNAPDNYLYVVPGVKFSSADKSVDVNVWGLISSDTDQSSNAIGVGVKKAL